MHSVWARTLIHSLGYNDIYFGTADESLLFSRTNSTRVDDYKCPTLYFGGP